MVKSILVVEDEPNIVLSLQFLMKKAGFDVRVARDGDEALAAVQAQAPDLILLAPRSKACAFIASLPGWRLVYADTGSALFVRRP